MKKEEESGSEIDLGALEAFRSSDITSEQLASTDPDTIRFGIFLILTNNIQSIALKLADVEGSPFSPEEYAEMIYTTGMKAFTDPLLRPGIALVIKDYREQRSSPTKE